MIHPTCARPGCERARVRRFGDDWWCLWHPDGEAPEVDAAGRLVERKRRTRPNVNVQDDLQREFDEAAA